MDRIVIHGGRPLAGEIEASGAKNAALPMMTAALLADGTTRLRNVPRLKDVSTMAHLLRVLGARVERQGNELVLSARECDYDEAPYELVKTMRASVYVLGPLLARLGRARVSLPGGCALGPRPIDQHIKGMQMLGARVTLEHGYVVARADRLQGTRIEFDLTSVGATANVLMAAVLAHGTTELANAACEPEIVALADLLNAMGAHVSGAGTPTIYVEGVAGLRPVEAEVIPDRIEAGTLAIAAAITGGDVRLRGCRPSDLLALMEKLRQAGVGVEARGDVLHITSDELSAIEVETSPHPGFPTDLQAQMLALLCVARGESRVTDTVFPERFNHVAELRRMGAEIDLEGNTARVRTSRLSGAPVMASDLRGSAALVLAGLVAEGETIVNRVYHLDRGYERLESKIASLGAEIARVVEEGAPEPSPESEAETAPGASPR
jgi:UDP-N-acetylglucosamine 1-carboxyvinyltransferase